jgi:transposase InsO family protein
MRQVHPQARTTPRTRAEIKQASETLEVLAQRYNVSKATARKWKNRADVQDRSHRPHKLSTTLAPGQEAVVVELRRMLLLPLDDLLVVTREFINAAVSRSGLDRCLRRHGVSQLRDLQVLPEGEEPRAKTFKDYEPGFIHVDLKYLPQMPGEGQRRYLFVAIDRATRWVFVHIYADQSEVSSCDFLWRLYQAAPMKISKILADNGSQFTDRFTGKTKQRSGKHAFDKRCTGLAIEHRLAPPRHPQTNGMVERFNGRIAEVIRQTRFKSGGELEATLTRYVQTYNHRIPQRALDHQSPIQALQKWRSDKPELFKKRVINQSGLDTSEMRQSYCRLRPRLARPSQRFGPDCQKSALRPARLAAQAGHP